jgi:hypothetical protein
MGLGTGRGWERQQRRLARAEGPLADWIRQSQEFLPQVFGQAQDVGQRIASLAPQAYDTLRGQVSQALEQLGGMQDLAGQATEQAFSPIASQALYQNALRQLQEGTQGQAAARGLLDAGATQAREETLGRDLAAEFARNQFAQQQQALAGQAGLLPLGTGLAQLPLETLPQLQQGLQAGYQIPMEALGSVFSQLAAAQNPLMAMFQSVLPQIAQSSRSMGK